MYREIHTLTGAYLRWSSVEAQGTTNAMEAHRNLLEPFHQDGRPDHYGTLEGGPRIKASGIPLFHIIYEYYNLATSYVHVTCY
jgi:hypothetical protein